MPMRPEDIKIILEAMKSGRRRIWSEEEQNTLRRARVAVFHKRWLDAKDAWILQAMYRKTQGGTV